MRRIGPLFLLIATLLIGCAEEPSSSMHSVSVKDLNGEVPSQGRSLFDQLTMRTEGDTWKQKVPFPFPELRKQLEAHMEGPMTATLIPRGRSLQRHASEEPFRFPRVVLASTGTSKARPGELGFQLKDRLYLGYVEFAKQLEVISFNPDLGRFEFQIVENYGPGLTPKVRYANREFCLACHQNEAPIFSNPSWDETAANPKIQEKLIEALNSDQYLGIPIRQLRNVPNAIDDSTDRANLLLPQQKMWRLGCDTGYQRETKTCRRLSSELAISYRLFGEFDSNRYEQLKPFLQRAWGKQFPSGLEIMPNNIPNFNPLQDFKGGSQSSFLEKIGVEVKGSLLELANDSRIPDAAEPLQKRSIPLEVLTIDREDAARIIFSLADEFLGSDIQWIKGFVRDKEELRSLLDNLDDQPVNPFAKESFVRCSLLLGLGQAAGVPTPPCERREFAQLPLPLATGAGEQSEHQDSRLQLFDRYCAACHASGPLNFLAGDDAKVLERMKTEAPLHRARLDWENGGQGAMPPANSELRRALEARPEDRELLMSSLREWDGGR